MANSNKIPRIELTRERPSTMESIQSLTRAIRESLRMHSARKERKRARKNQKKESSLLSVKDSRKIRSKSMDHAYVNDNDNDVYNELSDIGVSGVVVSDIGPAIERSVTIEDDPPAGNHTADDVGDDETALADEVFKDNEKSKQDSEDNKARVDSHNRRYSKSVDEVELAHLRAKSGLEKQPSPLKSSTPSPKPSSPAIRKTNPQMSLDICDSRVAAAASGGGSGSVGGSGVGVGGKQPARQSSVPVQSQCQTKDDTEMGSMDASALRKRFARLLVTLRSHKFSMSSLEERSSSAGGSVSGVGEATGNGNSTSSQHN